jgi:hypothetical protein
MNYIYCICCVAASERRYACQWVCREIYISISDFTRSCKLFKAFIVVFISKTMDHNSHRIYRF